MDVRVIANFLPFIAGGATGGRRLDKSSYSVGVRVVVFDGRFGCSERRPRKKRQTQVDGGRVKGVGRSVPIDIQGCVGIKRASLLSYQVLPDISEKSYFSQ